MKEIKSLFINEEVARIEKTEKEIILLICDDGTCMKKVEYGKFKDFLKDISFVCLTSWNKNLQNEYIEFVQYFKEIL